MISVICCVEKKGNAQEMWDSIMDNCIPNTNRDVRNIELVECVGHSSIGAGYNEGVQKAVGELLVFCHDDIRLWAGPGLWTEAMNQLAISKAGFIGVAGTARYAQDKLAWWTNQEPGQYSHDYLSGFAAHHNEGQTYMSSFGPLKPCVVLDGVFLACHRDVIKKLGSFDPALGWDFYDIDITLRAFIAGYTNRTVALPLLHYSIGNRRSNWARSRDIIGAKYFRNGITCYNVK